MYGCASFLAPCHVGDGRESVLLGSYSCLSRARAWTAECAIDRLWCVAVTILSSCMLALLVDTFLCTRIELKVCCSCQVLPKRRAGECQFFDSFQGRAAPNASHSLQEFGQGGSRKKGCFFKMLRFRDAAYFWTRSGVSCRRRECWAAV